MTAPRPALLGGPPIRDALPTWPPRDSWVAAVFSELAASGDWGRYHGPYVEQLRSELQLLHGACEVFLTCSGSFANELAIRALRLPAGAEIILSAYDYKPNFTNIVQLGYVPVLVDIHPESAQLDVDQLEAAFSDRTGAALISHLQGSAVDVARVAQLAHARGVAVIEDACQQLGGTVQGRIAGTGGDLGTLSFGGSKLITAGRGGAVVTARADLAQRLKLETQRGNDIYPLSELQAAMLLPQLSRLSEARAERQQMVLQLQEMLSEVPGLTPFSCDFEATSLDTYKWGCWYAKDQWSGLSRDVFCEALRAEGIPCDPGFRALHLIHARRRLRMSGELHHAEAADEEIVAIHHPFLREPHAVAELSEALTRIRRHVDELVTRE